MSEPHVSKATTAVKSTIWVMFTIKLIYYLVQVLRQDFGNIDASCNMTFAEFYMAGAYNYDDIYCHQGKIWYPAGTLYFY